MISINKMSDKLIGLDIAIDWSMKILLRLKNLSYIKPIYQSTDQIHHMAIAHSA